MIHRHALHSSRIINLKDIVLHMNKQAWMHKINQAHQFSESAGETGINKIHL